MAILLAVILDLFGIFGTGENNVVLVNDTGLKIARVIIDKDIYEDIDFKNDKFIVRVVPGKHDMQLVFRGGAVVKWQDFNFKDVHEITFKLVQNRINAHYE